MGELIRFDQEASLRWAKELAVSMVPSDGSSAAERELDIEWLKCHILNTFHFSELNRMRQDAGLALEAVDQSLQKRGVPQ